MFDKMSFNPATTGFKGYCATAIYRGQWDKVENAPNTMLVNVQGSLPKYNSGIGLSFMNDVIGLGTEMEVNLNYAYHLPIPGMGYLSGGIGLGIENIGFDPKWNAPMTGTDVSLDPSLPLQSSGTGLNVNVGLHWQGMKMPYFIGISSTHITQPTLANVNFTKARHYYVMAGYDIKNIYPLPANLTITPSILFKTDGTAGVTDINVLGDYWFGNPESGADGIYAGLTYRAQDAFAILVVFQKELISNDPNKGMLGGTPDIMKIGYSYDIITNKTLGQYGGGSHELVFNYCVFAPPPPVQRYGNVFILQ
jgi:type IX secretion system PorP/SprF family membrane protein